MLPEGKRCEIVKLRVRILFVPKFLVDSDIDPEMLN
jgi:hypothetical protein